MFPFTIIENFFPDPDKIVDIAKSVEYTKHEEDTNYAGARSENFHIILPDLHQYVCTKILQPFFSGGDGNEFVSAEAEIGFQIINPLHEDQYHPKNRGWVHVDGTNMMGGIIYLNPEPEPDTGTSAYREILGYSNQYPSALSVKEKFYGGEDVPDEEYLAAYNRIHDQYEETIKVENVYNRLVLFNRDCYHGQQTFGKEHTRLTCYFFFKNISSAPPFLR